MEVAAVPVRRARKYRGTKSFTFRKGISKMRKVVRARKTLAVKRGMLTPSRNCHSFRRWGAVERWDVTSSQGLGAMSFSLNDVQGYTEFDNLYDRYMITTVVLRFRIINNPDATFALNQSGFNPSTGNPTNWFPRLFFCKDYDDNTAETLANLRERAKTKMIVLKPNQYYKVAVRPAVAMQTYYTTSGAGYAPKWNQWIDMSQNGVPHYGLKWCVDCSAVDPNDTYPFKLEIEKQYYFKCKDVR